MRRSLLSRTGERDRRAGRRSIPSPDRFTSGVSLESRPAVVRGCRIESPGRSRSGIVGPRRPAHGAVPSVSARSNATQAASSASMSKPGQEADSSTRRSASTAPHRRMLRAEDRIRSAGTAAHQAPTSRPRGSPGREPWPPAPSPYPRNSGASHRLSHPSAHEGVRRHRSGTPSSQTLFDIPNNLCINSLT